MGAYIEIGIDLIASADDEDGVPPSFEGVEPERSSFSKICDVAHDVRQMSRFTCVQVAPLMKVQKRPCRRTPWQCEAVQLSI